MNPSRHSAASRALNFAPVFLIVALGVIVVTVAMNVLVTSAPVLSNVRTPAPSPTFTFPEPMSAEPYTSSLPDVTPVPAASLPAKPPTLLHSQITDKDPAGAWYYYVSYPALVSGTTPWADSIDSQILDAVSSTAQGWRVGPSSVRRYADKTNSLTADFTTDLLTPALASFTLVWVDDTMPGRKDKGAMTFTFDLATGSPIYFDDLFIDPQAALSAISGQAKLILRDQLGSSYDSDVVDSGLAPNHNSFANWSVTASGIKITLGQTQVTAYSKDLLSVVVPWAVLKNVMFSTGPVAQLAGF